MTDPIKVIQAVQEVGTETVEQGIKSTEQAINTVITGQELVADAKPMNEEEMAKARAEDERKKQEEMDKLKQIPGRNVEAEVQQIVKEKESEEEKEQREFLEKIKLQREAEERERESLAEMPGNAKKEAAKTQFAPSKRKKQEPDAAQMSQTSEFKGGKID